MLINKKGEIIEFIPVILFLIFFILLFVGFFYAFGDTTVNELTFKIEDGKLISSDLNEVVKDRISTWGYSYNKGFYNIKINLNNNTIITAINTGAGKQSYNINKFVECLKIEITDSDTKLILDEKEVCKK